MFVTKVYKGQGVFVNEHESEARPSKAQIAKLVETFGGDYAEVSTRYYATDVRETIEKEGEQS